MSFEMRYELGCPTNNKDCRYQPECPIPSEHHFYPKRLGRAVLDESGVKSPEYKVAHRFIEHPLHKAIVCRRIHDMLDPLAYQELPSHEEMQEWLHEHPRTSA